MPRPPATDREPGVPVAAATATASPLAWPGLCLPCQLPTPRPYRAARLVPGQCHCAERVPAGETPPWGLPRAGLRAPDKVWPAGVLAGCRSQLPRRLLLPRAKNERWVRNSRQLQLQEPELQLQPRARPQSSASACEAILPPRPPLSMPSAAVGEPERPGPGQRAEAGGR